MHVISTCPAAALHSYQNTNAVSGKRCYRQSNPSKKGPAAASEVLTYPAGLTDGRGLTLHGSSTGADYYPVDLCLSSGTWCEFIASHPCAEDLPQSPPRSGLSNKPDNSMRIFWASGGVQEGGPKAEAVVVSDPRVPPVNNAGRRPVSGTKVQAHVGFCAATCRWGV